MFNKNFIILFLISMQGSNDYATRRTASHALLHTAYFQNIQPELKLTSLAYPDLEVKRRSKQLYSKVAALRLGAYRAANNVPVPGAVRYFFDGQYYSDIQDAPIYFPFGSYGRWTWAERNTKEYIDDCIRLGYTVEDIVADLDNRLEEQRK
jgi:hypothetical protein